METKVDVAKTTEGRQGLGVVWVFDEDEEALLARIFWWFGDDVVWLVGGWSRLASASVDAFCG